MIQHFILTRFNIATFFGEKERDKTSRILDVEYLKERFEYFEKITIESIKSQTCQEFIWIVMFHEKTPTYFKKLIQHLKMIYPFVDIYYDGDFAKQFDFFNIIKRFIKEDKDAKFLTTRLDNDDFISKNFVNDLHQFLDEPTNDELLRQSPVILTYEYGVKFDLLNLKYYDYKSIPNHFTTLCSFNPRDCIFQYHHIKVYIDKQLPFIVLPHKMPMWGESIHLSNVGNSLTTNSRENKDSEKFFSIRWEK